MDAITVLMATQDERDVRQLEAGYPVWHVVPPRFFAKSRRARVSRLAILRAAVLRELLDLPMPKFISHGDAPADYDVPGRWESGAHQTWRIPAGFAPEEAASAAWLGLGGWLLYAAPHAVTDSWPDFYGSSPAVSTSWIAARGVRAAISSFHDDHEWTVVLAVG